MLTEVFRSAFAAEVRRRRRGGAEHGLGAAAAAREGRTGEATKIYMRRLCNLGFGRAGSCFAIRASLGNQRL